MSLQFKKNVNLNFRCGKSLMNWFAWRKWVVIWIYIAVFEIDLESVDFAGYGQYGRVFDARAIVA